MGSWGFFVQESKLEVTKVVSLSANDRKHGSRSLHLLKSFRPKEFSLLVGVRLPKDKILSQQTNVVLHPTANRDI